MSRGKLVSLYTLLTVDNAQSHVTAFRPISEAACSRSDDNISCQLSWRVMQCGMVKASSSGNMATWSDTIHTHPFNVPLSRTTQVSWHEKGKTNLDFTEARDSEWQWHQLGHMQICTLLQTNNHASTHHSVFTGFSCRPTNSIKALKARYTHTRLTALCPGLPGWAGTRKEKPIWIYWSKRQWVAVASAEPYASLHLAPDR